MAVFRPCPWSRWSCPVADSPTAWCTEGDWTVQVERQRGRQAAVEKYEGGAWVAAGKHGTGKHGVAGRKELEDVEAGRQWWYGEGRKWMWRAPGGVAVGREAP